MSKAIGRLYITGGGVTAVQDAKKTNRTLVAEIPGNYTCEKEDGMLRVYISSEIEVEPFGKAAPQVAEPLPREAQDLRRQIRTVSDLSARARQIFGSAR